MPFLTPTILTAITTSQPDAWDAMNQLDAVIQFRCTLRAGEAIVANDKQIFRARTSFEDHLHAVDLKPRLTGPGDSLLKRTYSRLWVNA